MSGLDMFSSFGGGYGGGYGGFGPSLSIFAGISVFMVFLTLAITALIVIALWHLFKKAGEAGWLACIPFYNMYVLFKLTWGNGLWCLLLFAPIGYLSAAVWVITMIKLTKAIGKGCGWAFGMALVSPVFLCIAAFSSDITYNGVPSNEGIEFEPPVRPVPPTPTAPPAYSYNRATGKFCSVCGFQADENTKFCTKCGTPL